MKIEGYTIGMESRHETDQSIRVSETRTRNNLAVVSNPESTPADSPVTLTISPQAQQMFQDESEPTVSAADDSLRGYISHQTYLKSLILAKMLKAITGKDFRIMLYPDESAHESSDGAAESVKLQAQSTINFKVTGMGINIIPIETVTRRVTLSEKESLSFTAAGQVRTADGRVIEFSAGLEMRRELFIDRISQSVGRVADPLMFNFDNRGVSLSQEKIQFDLNTDGNQENISFVNPGSGFLALDRNKDGQINDGGELFGPASGNGFGDLAFYDRDHNGWIDENDPVFNQLQIWEKDNAGQDHLFFLGDKGIGAIYLGSVKAEFNLQNQGQTNGLARRAGMFLEENGTTGTIQQIDLVV